MPHAAIIVTGAVIFSVAAYTVYREVVQPHLEQRRRDEEDEWNAQEMERAMQLSILEHQHEEQRRVDQERWEQTHLNSHSTSSSARYDGDTGIMRRRRHVDPFSDANEMQEVPSSSSKSTANALLFDAGPSSRLDTIHCDLSSDVHTHNASEDEELLETARSLSLSAEEIAFVKGGDLLNSPRSSAGSALDTYSVIEPDSRPASRFTSRSQSPLVVDVSASSVSPSFHTPIVGSQQSLTAAVLEQAQLERESARSTRAASPTPTLRSLTYETDNTLRTHTSPSYASVSRAPSEASATIISRPISPFSEVGFVSAHSSDEDNEMSRPGSVAQRIGGAGSDRDSQWSDLGEDSSDEEGDAKGLNARQQEELRHRRQRFFAGDSAAI